MQINQRTTGWQWGAVAILLCLAAPVALAQTPVVQRSGLSGAQPAGATPSAAADPANAVQANAKFNLNFNNAEIADVALTIGLLIQKNVVVDPRVKGTITLKSLTPVTPTDALSLFATQLRSQGFAMVDADGTFSIVPEGEAKIRAARTVAGPVAASDGGQIVTKIFRLQHENVNALVPILRPLIAPNNTINAIPSSNSLVITDYADNLKKIERLVQVLDKDAYVDLDVLPLTYAIAGELAPIVRDLLDAGRANAGNNRAQNAESSPVVIPDARINALLVRGTNDAMNAMIRSIVAKLDVPSASGAAGASQDIHVVYLKNADAQQLAVTLRAALASSLGGTPAGNAATGAKSAASGGTASSSTGGSAGDTANLATTGGNIQADTTTNSLIISAPEAQYRQLLGVIDKLDARRAQVYVESLIAEISADKTAELGVQWQGVIGSAGGAAVGVLGTNFGIGGANIVGLSQGLASGVVAPSTGVNFGYVSRVNGTPTLGLLARFLESSGEANVLSTPNLVTLDNHEAKIVIGQNVPFVTGQYTSNNAANGSVNPFQTVERKDVGLTLRVKPQISESGTVKMQIFQEVSRLDAASVNSSAGLITQKRSIESNVLVEDGSIVVLGGLLQDDFGTGEEKVPGLGDLPILGGLFRAETKVRKKTNLMIFLRPVVLRGGESTQKFSAQRYNQIRQEQLDRQPVEAGPDTEGKSAPESAVIPELRLP
jgi:general secretion pathway protein D